MFWLALFFSVPLFAQPLVREYQEAPIGNECPTYRESRKYAVELKDVLQFTPLSQVADLKNGNILFNSLMEDHLPYLAIPRPATVMYRVAPDGTRIKYPFSSTSKKQQSLTFASLVVSENEKFAVSIAYHATYSKGNLVSDNKLVLLTDLESKVTKEIVNQVLVDDTVHVMHALVGNEGQVMVIYEDGKRSWIENGVTRELEPTTEGSIQWKEFKRMSIQNGEIVLSKNNGDGIVFESTGNKIVEWIGTRSSAQIPIQDFTGITTEFITYKVDNMTYQTENRRLLFKELGQVVGETDLTGCTLKTVETITNRKARVICEEGLLWYELNTNEPVSELNRNIIGFLPCRQ